MAIAVPSITPPLMLRLYIYGYLNGIRSSRKLEQESRRRRGGDVAVQQHRSAIPSQYDQFWRIWHSLYPYIKISVQGDPNRHLDSIVHNYLLAWPWWNETAKEWHTAKA